jgi:membrane protease YdiL (CAAX protease family)
VNHGALFVVLMAIAALIPPLRSWPWLWLAPFLAYFVVVAIMPDLQSSMSWLRAGSVTANALAATIGLMGLTVLILTRFQATSHPDVRELRALIPTQALGGIFVAGVVFSLLNAALEEFVFRGVLFDSLQARWGTAITLAVTSLLFGLGHLHGYPPGPFGACLAALFGCALGILRLWSGGLALPIAAHIAADATIYWILFARS